MIYKETLNYLQNHYPNRSLLVKFSQTDTHKLYDHLKQHFAQAEVKSSKNDIRRAIIEYTKEISKTVVLFRGLDLISITFTPLKKLDSNSVEFGVMLESIKKSKEHIERVVDREDLMVLDEYLTSELYKTVFRVDFIDYKDAIRRAVKEALGLNNKDVVLFLNNQIYIRFFIEEDKKQHIKIDRRFGGLPPEELERLKNELFKDSVSTTFRELVKQLAISDLDFTKISNEFYEKNALALIQATIVEYLKERLNYEDEIIDSFCGYLLRENFAEVHEELAAALLDKVSLADSNAEKFIKYYTGDIAVIDGVKYRLPNIEDSTNVRWNFSTIKAITAQYGHSMKQIEERVAKTKDSQIEYDSYDEQIEKAKSELERAKKELVSVKIEVEESGILLNKLREELANARKEALRNSSNEIEATITELSTKIKNTTSSDEALFKSRSKAEILVKEKERLLEQLEHKKVVSKRKITEEQERLQTVIKNQQEVATKYKIMQKALAKSLIKRKVKL